MPVFLYPVLAGLTGVIVGMTTANMTQPDVVVENATVGVTTQKALIYGAVAIGVFYAAKRFGK